MARLGNWVHRTGDPPRHQHNVVSVKAGSLAPLEEQGAYRALCCITPGDIHRCGERDRESLRRRAAHVGPIGDDTLLYRVEFHLAGPPACQAPQTRC